MVMVCQDSKEYLFELVKHVLVTSEHYLYALY